MKKNEASDADHQEEFKLFVVSHMGPYPCWSLEVASNAGSAFQKCRTNKRVPEESDNTSCKVEEVRIPGFRIKIIPDED